jgi:hypothetical protein
LFKLIISLVFPLILVGKPGNTAKLKEKIFYKFGIFPRQSRIPGGTDFFQVKKKVQLVGKHLIIESRNLKYQKSQTTKLFRRKFHGQSSFFYRWNTLSMEESQNLKQLTRLDFHKPSRSKPLEASFDSLQSHNLSLAENLLGASDESNKGKRIESKESNLEKNKMSKMSGEKQVMVVYEDESPKPTGSGLSQIELRENTEQIAKESERRMQDGLVYGTLDQEFLPLLAAEYLLLQMHSQERFKRDISTKYVPLIAPIRSHCWSLEELDHLWLLMHPIKYRMPTILPTSNNSNNPAQCHHLSKFSITPVSIYEATNHPEEFKAQSPLGDILVWGTLFRQFSPFSPDKAWVLQTYVEDRSRRGSRKQTSFLGAANQSKRRIQVPITPLRGNLLYCARHKWEKCLVYCLLFSEANEAIALRALPRGCIANLSTPNHVCNCLAVEERNWLSRSMGWLDRSRLPASLITRLRSPQVALLGRDPRLFTSRFIILHRLDIPILIYRKRKKIPQVHHGCQGRYIGHRGRHISRSYPCPMSSRPAFHSHNAHAISRLRLGYRPHNRESGKGRKGEGLRESERVTDRSFPCPANRSSLYSHNAYAITRLRVRCRKHKRKNKKGRNREGVSKIEIFKLPSAVFDLHTDNFIPTMRIEYARAHNSLPTYRKSKLHWHYRIPPGYTLLYE